MRAVPRLHGWYCRDKVLLTWVAPSARSALNEPELLCPVGAPGVYTAATESIWRLISSSSVTDPSGLSTSSLVATRQMPVSLRVRCHATRSVMTSWAALRGVPPRRH